MTRQQMHDHVVGLAGRHRITIFWIRQAGRAMAVAETLEVHIPPVRSTLTYATALHEIGHCLGRYQTSRNIVTIERWAWIWARQHALVWTQGMQRSMDKSIAWYKARRPWPARIVHGPPGCFLE